MNLQGLGRTPRTFSLAITLIIGCAPLPTPPPAKSRAMVSPTRPAEECIDLVARVRAHPDSFSPAPPQLAGFAIPPFEGTPSELRGRTIEIRMLVDEQGATVGDSTEIAPPIEPSSFDQVLRKQAARYRFHPAVLEGCAVPGRTRVTLTLANR